MCKPSCGGVTLGSTQRPRSQGATIECENYTAKDGPWYNFKLLIPASNRVCCHLEMLMVCHSFTCKVRHLAQKIVETSWDWKARSLADALAGTWQAPQLPPGQDGDGKAQAGGGQDRSKVQTMGYWWKFR